MGPEAGKLESMALAPGKDLGTGTCVQWRRQRGKRSIQNGDPGGAFYCFISSTPLQQLTQDSSVHPCISQSPLNLVTS